MRAIVITVGGVIAGLGLAWGLVAFAASISNSAYGTFGQGLSGEGNVFAGFAIMGLGVGILVAGATHHTSREPDRRPETERSPAGVP